MKVDDNISAKPLLFGVIPIIVMSTQQ